MRVQLRPMTPDEFTEWYRRAREHYIQERIDSGEAEDVAREIANGQYERYFPGGTPGEEHDVLVVEGDGQPVGMVWLGPYPQGPPDPSVAFLYNIEVDEAHRGRGLGRAALAAAEEHARTRGASQVALNVFGGNAVARALYASAGYLEASVSMTKQLG
jgi:ribosomal protein S18 acetylase RimI-like enzyme